MTITQNRVLELLIEGYEVYTVWFFNNFTATGIIGYREYQTMKCKDGIITLAI